MSRRVDVRLERMVDAAAVGAATLFVAAHFPAALMLSSSTPTGGDMGSHYYPAVYLREVLLPNRRITGWCPGSFAGYPLFQMYFPLPFLLMALLAYLIPFAVAFKLVSALGCVLLPACAYGGLRLAQTPFPGPALGAVATLGFLFMEDNSMWGGNIPSMLAGEFSFSLSLALMVLALGALRRAVETGRGRAWTGALVALVGLSHGYTLLWLGLVSLSELVTIKNFRRRFISLAAIHGLAILLMGFWLLPLLLYAPWTTAFNFIWVIGSWREMLPPILWPAAIVAATTLFLQAVLTKQERRPFPRELGMLWAGTALSFLLYFWAYGLHLIDIRFLPFFQLGLCLCAGAGLGHLLARLPAAAVWPLVGLLAFVPFVSARVNVIPGWIIYNYSGFETKPGWQAFRDVNRHLAGTFRDPRVVYEHSPDHESAGTVRAFENLPLFSGRSTLEGIYMQSALSSPAVFYVQSEISKDISCPLPDYGCSRLDLDRGIGHLRMFNVSQFVARSDTVKKLAAKHPRLRLEKSIGPYQVYRLLDNDNRYAVPLRAAPVLVHGADWKAAAYRWFKRAGPDDAVPVFARGAAQEASWPFDAVFAGSPQKFPRRNLPPAPILRETIETDRITLTGCAPGHPILIRISYHPRWKTLSGETVWLAGPSFMIVVPRGERVELVFGDGFPAILGRGLTALGCLLFLLFILPINRMRAFLARPPVWEESPAAWPLRRRRAYLGAGLAATTALFATVLSRADFSDAGTIYLRGLAAYKTERLIEAAELFAQARRRAPLSATAIHALYFEAMSFYRLKRWTSADLAFRRLLEEFPEAQSAAEATYHRGLIARELGRAGESAIFFREVERKFPETPWARYVRSMP